ncbi:MAG: lysophospholipid acyltransferase family protein [Verrucomicrobiia bacterium]
MTAEVKQENHIDKRFVATDSTATKMYMSYAISRHFARLIISVYFRCNSYNSEYVPITGPVIIASNHVSYFDPFIVGAAVNRRICYLCRDSAFKWPIIGYLLKHWNAVPVDREGRSPRGLKAVLDRLKTGEAVMLFPEGTRTYDGNLQQAKPGIGLLVAQTDAPVVPVRIFGMWEAFNRFMRLPRPKPVNVVFGKALSFEHKRRELQNASPQRAKEIYKEIADEIMEAIGKIQNKKD